MGLNTLTIDDKAKLKRVIDEGISISQQIDDLKSSLKDTVKTLADELEVKPAIINKAIRIAFKSTMEEEKETVDEVEEILQITGKI